MEQGLGFLSWDLYLPVIASHTWLVQVLLALDLYHTGGVLFHTGWLTLLEILVVTLLGEIGWCLEGLLRLLLHLHLVLLLINSLFVIFTRLILLSWRWALDLEALLASFGVLWFVLILGELLIIKVMLPTENELLGQPDCFLILGQTLQVVWSRTVYTLDYEDTVSWGATELTVMERTSETLDLHGVDAGDILVQIDTVDMVVLKASTQSASDHILAIVDRYIFFIFLKLLLILPRHRLLHIFILWWWVLLDHNLTGTIFHHSFSHHWLNLLSAYFFFFLELLLILVGHWLAIDDVVLNLLCCFGFALLGEQQDLAFGLAAVALGDVVQTVVTLPVVHTLLV